MIGRGAEETALVRHSARTIMALANADVPIMSVVVRKAYGLAFYVMGSDAFEPDLLVGWPTAEFGGMGLEGAVRLAMRKELDAIADPEQREQTLRAMVAYAEERGKAINMASYLEIDGVIDPADTRGWLLRGLKAAPSGERRAERRFVDTW